MSLLAESLEGAKYQVSLNDDRESSTNGAAEFMRRKRWPEVLLKELIGSAAFCLKPAITPGSGQYQNGEAWRWKIIYASPSVSDMLGQKPSELEGRDFFELVFANDRPQLQTYFNTLLAPPLLNIQTQTLFPPSSARLGESHTAYIRMLSIAPTPSRANFGSHSDHNSGGPFYGSSVSNGVGPVVWELRGHATGIGEDISGAEHSDGLTMAADGTVVPGGAHQTDTKHKAIWLMGRRVGERFGEDQQSLDAFLELKLENERLQAEFKDLQAELDVDVDQPTFTNGNPGSTPSSPSSPSSPINCERTKNRVGRPSKASLAVSGKKQKSISIRGSGGEGETMYVCVTCGRTDSPEWRKGPLGPKTLCNACGLRWAKRNSTAQIPKKATK
ncbi:cutinase palindrome-binding protein [Cryptococcus depauperatus CBS 7841]|uniref:Cutinase palindrome-binding protein n=1 Tax=Cryptococcus depauperatus CBS 7841 TaxID=1295531 RepID=A0A1E3IRF3_9TREE|nr:cutinase palindrome-binding protein [Cryptococcus depauperatus CBS 7841]